MPELISIIVPVHNEQTVLQTFHKELSRVMNTTGLEWEAIYIDDGSSDGSALLLEEIRERNSNTAVISLSRNFGKEIALTAGLDHARGEAVILIDADLQDPPSVIPEFLHWWREGYDVVYGRRTHRDGESWLKIKTAQWFYQTMSCLSNVEIPRDAGDFRLLSRRAVDALKTLHETHRYMKGLYAWIGFPQKEVVYRRETRAAGHTKWNYWKLWNFALEGITSFSDLPLKLSTYLGTITSIGAFLYGVFIMLRTLIYGNPVAGYPSLMVVVLFLGGVQLICIGIIGEYLARTYNESKARTLYFVKEYLPVRDEKQALPERR